ncbi:hypothetical protein [Amphritea balenae]|uniref:DUF4435 domain-containing protein n=1 Tax=Amphritea balenae TaxID=452629 RepID=A0A3P1SSZ2_9GAMM|nr:hypothetical protein [Amphritea balenae]RRC99725.1 hypothetical protein EHS89_09560 [Amphritea balenae]GGK79333.1 hypothetical protein GCM10007941_31980 [Amphritea balenae]
MSFTRTSSGLTNNSLFYGVDLIIYTEGGNKSYTADEVLRGAGSEQSVDIKFWSNVLVKHGLTSNIKFKALGSKTCAKEICRLLSEGEIENVAVAVDSDLDDFIGVKIDSPFVLYTKGYSWENDVYRNDLVKDQIESLIFKNGLEERYKYIVDKAFCDLGSKSKTLINVEIMFRLNGVKLITACNGERFFDSRRNPSFNRKQLSRLIRDNKEQLARPIFVPEYDNNLCSFRYCYGKLVEAMSISLISYICRTMAGFGALPKEFIVAAMIERYARSLEVNKDPYYQAMVNRMLAA